MKYKLVFIICMFFFSFRIWATEKKVFTLEEAIELASKQSLDAFIQKNMYLGSYWEFRSFQSDRLPQLGLNSTPLQYGSNVQKQYNYDQNRDEYVERKYLNSNVGVSLSQNIAATGGQVYVNSGLGYIKNYGTDANTSFASTPINIGFSQTINGYNALKWQSKIEPLKFEIAKKEYLQSREEIAGKTVNKFFAVVDAQIEITISKNNLSNADTLYKIGQGRFKVGTITQDELLSLQLRQMNAKLSMVKSRQALVRAISDFNSFLGLDEATEIECLVPSKISAIDVDAKKAVMYAVTNSSNALNYQQRQIQAAENVKQALSQSGLSANISAQYGLTKASSTFNEAYQDPNKSQQVTIGVNIPLLDWGKAKGTIAVARSNEQVVNSKIKQDRIDFQQNVMMNVMEFNLQAMQVENAAQADTIAQLGYQVTIQRFKIGKLDVLKLNAAQNDLESAKRVYIGALQQYWSYYYIIRGLTLYDFIKDRQLSEDFDKLLK